MNFTPLTRAQLASMPPSARAARIEHWHRVVAALQDDHWRRYPHTLWRGVGVVKHNYPMDWPPLEDFNGVGASLARGFRESA